ncbi:hypothetical protein U9M48_031716 [Paspalum notatum var. saurae]|uniref:Uncharacterized protein n=1 Tax=Paspalum notatum var. saurae TaxID=547442 RepID=A0AAQ3U3J9_PASNO
MAHPADSYAWKALDEFDPEFPKDARNIRFGLATDGFTPFNESAASYSCWPVFAIPYNLPPSMCMKYEFIFLCLIIPSPKHPGPKLNMMLQPLIKELKQLWIGVEAYDISLKQKFTLRAAYLWSIHDFLAYGIFAGWSVYGTLTCLICGADTRCFRLEFGGKICYFDCHRCWLSSDDIFRGEKNAFRKDTVCYDEPPKRLSGQEIADQLASGCTTLKGPSNILAGYQDKEAGAGQHGEEEDAGADEDKYFCVDPSEVDYAEKVLDQAAMKICNDTFSNLRLHVTNAWLKSQGQQLGHFWDCSEMYLTAEEYEQIRHPLFEDQPGPYKALCELWASEDFQERSKRHRNEEYGKEMCRRYGDKYDWRNAPIDGRQVTWTVIHVQRHD